jgi:hypothetical protein
MSPLFLSNMAVLSTDIEAQVGFHFGSPVKAAE